MVGIDRPIGSTLARRKKRQNRVDIVFRQIAVSVEKRDQLAHDLIDAFERLSAALEINMVSAGRYLGIGKCVFDAAQIDIIETEQEKRLGFLYQNVFFFQFRLILWLTS